jgi:uncharacterized membrane-anchored protein
LFGPLRASLAGGPEFSPLSTGGHISDETGDDFLRTLRYWLALAALHVLFGVHPAEAADERQKLIREWEIRWIFADEAAETGPGSPRADDSSWIAASAGRLQRMPAAAAGV